MKSSLLYLKLTFAILLLGWTSNSFAQKTQTYQRMAMYIAANSVDEIQPPQERAAAKLFQERFSTFGTILTPKDVDLIKYPDFDCLWINIDSIGKSQGVEKFRGAFISDKFLQTVKKFRDDGGNLYMSKYAIELLYSDGIGSLADYLRPNVFDSSEGVENADIWSINAEIGARMKIDDPSQYADHRNHPIYDGLRDNPMSSLDWCNSEDHKKTYASPLYDVFPVQGNVNHQPTHRENHACMWRLAMKTDDNAKVGIYIGYEGVHSFEEIDRIENPQERAAVAFLLDPNGFFKQIRPNVHIEVICPGDVARIEDVNNFDCIWIHIDRSGIERGWEHLPEAFRNDRLIAALKNYSQNGGQLLLTKQATQLIVPIGRVSDEFAPTEFNSGEGGNGTDVWQINAHLGWDYRESSPENYFDRTGYDIYRDLAVENVFEYPTFPMEGTGNGTEMWREDHNCMWDLNAIPSYKELGGRKLSKFQEDCNARILGTWGQVKDDAVIGIVEFRPTIQYRGRIIANGLAACEWAPRSGVNAYHHNLELLTFNCLRYLVTVTDFKFVNDGPNGVARFEKDANATVLGTWGQDWNHQAAGIVEFHPDNAIAAYSSDPELDELNKNKAPKGTIIANGISCIQLYHDKTPANDYQENTNRLTENIIQYLSPWHKRILSGVEDVEASLSGSITATAGRIGYSGFDRPVTAEVYGLDGRLLESHVIQGDGVIETDVRGPVIVAADGTVTKLIL